MSLIILGKIGFAALGTAAVSIGGIALFKFFTPTTFEIYGFIEDTTVDISSASADSTIQTPTPAILECQIKDKTNKFACKVEVMDKLTTEDKNHVLIDALSISKDWKPVTEALVTKKFYKIKTSSSELDKTKPLIIEVFKKEDPKNKLGTINSMFIAKNKTIISGKTCFDGRDGLEYKAVLPNILPFKGLCV